MTKQNISDLPPVEAAHRLPARRILKLTLIALASMMILSFAAIWIVTSLVIHFPTAKERQLSPQQFSKIASAVPGLRRVTFQSSDGVNLVAWWLPTDPAPGQQRYGIVLTHGGNSNKSFYLPLAKILNHHGFDVIMVDLRGNGESGPSPHGLTLGITEGLDTAAAANFLMQHGITRIGASGASMGGASIVVGTANSAAINGPLAIESSAYDATRVFELALGAMKFPEGPVRHAFARVIAFVGLKRMGASWEDAAHGHLPVDRLARTISPRQILLIVGDKDPIVSLASVQEYSHDFAGPTTLIVVPGAKHVASESQPDLVHGDILNFFEQWKSNTR